MLPLNEKHRESTGKYIIPRRLDPVPVAIMDGVMGIFDPSNTRTNIPEEIHLPFTHLQGQEINLKCRRYKKKSKYSPWSKEIRKKEFLSRTQKNNWLKSIIQSFILLKSLILSVKMQMCYLLHYIWWEEHYSHESRVSEYKNYSLMFMDW